MKDKAGHEEVDLLELAVKLLQTLVKNWVIVLVLPLMGGITGFFWSRSAPERFESKMMIQSEVLSKTECDFLLRQLELNPFQGLPSDMRESMLELTHQIYPTGEQLISIDPSQYPNEVYAEITIRAQKREFLPAFQKAIEDYIENSEAVKQKRQQKIEFYSKLINKIDRELALLEQVKTHTAYEKQATALRPSDLFTSSVDLTELRTNYEQKKHNAKVVLLVTGFDQVVNVKRSTFFCILLGLGLGLFLVAIVLPIKYFIHYYQRYQKTAMM